MIFSVRTTLKPKGNYWFEWQAITCHVYEELLHSCTALVIWKIDYITVGLISFRMRNESFLCAIRCIQFEFEKKYYTHTHDTASVSGIRIIMQYSQWLFHSKLFNTGVLTNLQCSKSFGITTTGIIRNCYFRHYLFTKKIHEINMIKGCALGAVERNLS